MSLSISDEEASLVRQVHELTQELARTKSALATRTRELNQAFDDQTATSEVLTVIGRSPANVQKVLDQISETAARLCDADYTAFFRLRDGRYHIGASNRLGSDLVQILIANPIAPGRNTCVGRTALERRVIQIPDALSDPELSTPENLERQRVSGIRTVLGVPIMRNGEPVAVVFLARAAVNAFSDRQIALVQTLGEQAHIAIENARLFEAEQMRTREVVAKSEELAQSLEYQTAISAVLGVISRSPTNLQPVFETIAANATRLCGAKWTAVNQYDGEVIRLVALDNMIDPAEREVVRRLFPRKPTPGGAVDNSILSREVAYLRHLGHETGFPHAASAAATGARCIVAVPMLRAGIPIGTISVTSGTPDSFSQKQVDLLKAFADQAVIAINNVGLFEEVQARTTELTESLEYQTATSEVLSVISRSPNDLQPVLNAIATTAAALCEANGTLVLLGREGQLQFAAAHDYDIGISATGIDSLPIDRSSTAGRAFVDCKPVHIHDLRAVGSDMALSQIIAERSASRTTLGIPLLRDGKALGCLFLRRTEVCPFNDKQIALLQTFADQAVIAINNVGLFEEVQARTKEVTEALEYQTALSEVLGVISRSPNELQPVLDVVAENAARLCMASDARVFRVDGDRLRRVAGFGDIANVRWVQQQGLPLTRGSVVSRATVDRKTVHVVDLAAEPEDEYPDGKAVQREIGHRTLVATPLLRDGVALGALLIRRMEVKPFTDKQISLLETFASQAVIAINNVGLFEEVQARTKEVTEALEYQTAISEVLSVLALSPGELQPVLDTIAATGVRPSTPCCSTSPMKNAR